MTSNNASEKTVSDVQSTTIEERGHEPTVEHEPSGRSACPECEGQVITEDEQSFCTDCGLIVADEWVDLSPTLNDLGLVGDADQSIETVDPLRTDKGLHTKIGRNTDGRGNPLSNEQWEKVQRLRKWHKRMQFGEKRKRTKRLNEGLRDVEMIGGNLSLPNHVVKQAAQHLRSASEARLPGGRMAWEALAGGAVLLAARASSVDRVRWNRLHASLTPPLLDATNHTPSPSPLMRLHTGVSEVVAARAATAGSEHGAVGGAAGRPRAEVANKNGERPAQRRVSRSSSRPTPGSSVPCSAS